MSDETFETSDEASERYSNWCFFDAATGIFSGRSYSGDEAGLKLQLDHLGASVRAFEGSADHQRQRVDLESGNLVAYVPPKPNDTAEQTHSWSTEALEWVAEPTLEAARREASDAIDTAAGAARLRYITEAPGQQAVYLRKAEESRAFRAAGYAGDPPAYVAAEAQAMEMTPQAAADRILAIADAWDNQLSPAIEGMRIGGKNAVALATTVDEVTAARGAALAQLAAV